jgi:carbonic anhydrase/acetyltransferase-like protein (isoleucine patch superfamily)
MDIRIDEQGRLGLPAEVLEELGWYPGLSVGIERVEGGLRLQARGQKAAGSEKPAGNPAAPGRPASPSPSPYGSGMPAGVDAATLKEEARQLADSMRNVAQPFGALSLESNAPAVDPPLASEPQTPAELVNAVFPPHGAALPTIGSQGGSGAPGPGAPPAESSGPGAAPSAATGPTIIADHARAPRIPTSCYVAPGAFVAGDVTLGEECSVWPGASLRGDVNRIEIGARTNVQDGAVIHVDHEDPAVIGSGVTIGHQATVHGCRVEDDVLIGIHAVVLNGAALGKGCMVAAGAVVTPGTEVPPGKLVLGVPGKVARDLTPEELAANRANAAEYVRLRGEYLATGVQVSGTRAAGGCSGVQADKDKPGLSDLNTRTPEHLNTPLYRCRRVKTTVEIDGALDEAAWKVAEPAGQFMLSSGSGAPKFPTEARLCWDETHLYVSFSCQDSDIWGTYTKRDEPLYDEEVVELFLCPSANLAHYFEFEVSPRNTVFDAKVFSPAGDRRMMVVDREWDAAGMRTAVRVSGTLDRRDDHDIGWIVEMAIPFKSLGLAGPPKPREEWRMNLYRIERGEVTEFSAWSPTLKSPPDFHVPTRFGTLVFVEE